MSEEEEKIYMKICKYDEEPKNVILDLFKKIENQQKEIEKLKNDLYYKQSMIDELTQMEE